MRRPKAALARDLDAIGLGMAPSTLAQGLHRLGRLVKPLKQAIAEHLGQAAAVQADETSWPVQHIEGQQNPKPRHWLWMVCCEDAVWMRILPTRGLPSGRELLGQLGQAVPLTLVCDRWSAYRAFCRRYPNVRLAHHRRDFCCVEAAFPELQAWAGTWLEKIGGLFHWLAASASQGLAAGPAHAGEERGLRGCAGKPCRVAISPYWTPTERPC